jgi:biotin carboxyl carrier protein
VIEAMKMETMLRSRAAGRVVEITARLGDMLPVDAPILLIV